MTPGELVRLHRRTARQLGGIAVGVFAAYLAALVLVGDRFADRVAGVPLGLWLAVGAIAASYAVVLLHTRVSTQRLDPARRALPTDERR